MSYGKSEHICLCLEKGNVILLKDAIEQYSADVVRLFLMASAEPWQDFDWREKEVLGTKRRLEWFREFAAKVEKDLDLTIKMWDRVPQKDLFQGNYSTCCIGMGGGNGSAMPHY